MFKKKIHSDLSESELIRLAPKEESAFTLLYEQNFEKVYRFVFGRLNGNEELAGELTQLTFLKAWTAIGKYQDRGYQFSTWLIRIAQNEINMYFRANNKMIELEVTEKQIHSFFGEMEDENVSDEMIQKALSLLENLEQSAKDLIELRFFQQMSYKDVADIYDITEANAKMRVKRIIEKIQKQLK